LLGDKSFLLSEQRNAFVMYAVQGRSWVSLGDPVGQDDQRIDLIWNYLELVERADGWPVFYQVDQQHLPLYLEEGLDMLKLGEEARVPLEQFALDAGERDGLRQAHETVRREHCRFEMLPPDPLPGFLAELQGISDAWLAHRHMAEKRFALASFDAGYLSRFPCAIVRQSGRVIAFANVWPGAGRAELSADLIRYRPGAPPGLMEYLLVELMLWGRQEGYRWFNLGMGPLAGMEDQPLAPLWTRTAGLTFRHGAHFSSLAELRQFKEKFAPVWQAKYLVSPGGLALPRIITDVATLIAGKPLAPAPK
jgi:phosphatidylglycerol lysyltransferase